jgi:hypothetical protein
MSEKYNVEFYHNWKNRGDIKEETTTTTTTNLNDGDDDVAGMDEDAWLSIDGPGGGSPAKDTHAATMERVTLGPTHDSPPTCGGDEHGSTVSTHWLDNKGGQNRGRRPMKNQPRYKMMY